MTPQNSTEAVSGNQTSEIVPNFRSVTSCTGSTVAFRCSELHGLPSNAKERLLELGVTDVVDLRTSAESHQLPDNLPTQIVLHVADVLSDDPNGGATKVATLAAGNANGAGAPMFSPSDVANLMESLGGGKSRSMMLQTYGELVMLPSALTAYHALLNLTLQSGRTVAFHCTAGKDRTGWGAAVLETLAGQDLDRVLVNYLDSNAAWKSAYEPVLDAFSAAGGEREALGDLLWVSPDYLIHAQETMVENFGSIEDYVLKGLNFSQSHLDSLKSRLEG